MKLSAAPLALAVSAGALAAMGARPVGAPAAAADTAEETSALPWLHGFASRAETAEPVPDVVGRMARWREADASCSAAAYGGLSIAADVVAPRGAEEVLASFTQGVLVLDARGRLIASATALPCQGSADEVEAIAAGDAHIDRPVIALAVTTGGHRESSTWLVLYGVAGGVLAPLFQGVVEDHRGERARTGTVTLLPGALLYRTPSGTQTMWIYSADQQRYTELALVAPPQA
ncbi:MAG TPA: hypothetical protein VGD37_15765 [Kofleriaceae bacterium]